MRTMLFAASLMATILALGCGSKGGDQAKTAGAAAAPTSAGSGTTLAKRTFTLGGLKAEIAVPEGWKEQEVGSGVILKAPGSGLYTSMVWISATCQGDCSTVAENIAKHAAEQKKMHEGWFQDISIAVDEPLKAGGHHYQLKMAHNGNPATHYVHYRFQSGWDEAVMCSAQLLDAEAGQVDQFKQACMDMVVTVAAK